MNFALPCLFAYFCAAVAVKQVPHILSPAQKVVPWVPTLINRGLENFIPRGKTRESPCTAHGQVYEQHLRNLTLWAVQMVDASSRGPSGILTGNNYQFGDFDECIDVHELNHGIRGKYLMIKFTFWEKALAKSASTKVSTVYKYPPPDASMWDVFVATKDRRIKDRNVIHWALCVPESCEEDDVEQSLNTALKPIFTEVNLDLTPTVESVFTYPNGSTSSSEDMAFNIFIAVTLVMVVLVISATTIELRNNSIVKNKEWSWLENISLITNWRKLIQCESQEFASISGMKTMSMVLIIFGHRWMVTTFNPMFNQQENEMLLSDLTHTLVTNGALVVNTFLVITGFVTYYKITKDVTNNRRINVFQYIYHRWMRITPLYAYVMAFAAVVYPKLTTGGPLGRNVIFDASCGSGTSWLTHLLYINNYVEPESQCLLPSWYLATDMQLYILCAICGFVLWAHKTTGLVLLYSLTVIVAVIPGITVFFNNYSGVYLFYFVNFKNLFDVPEFIVSYLHTHNRASPYIIGMMAGYTYYQIKSSKSEWSKVFAWTLFLSAVVIHVGTWLGAWVFYLPERPYIILEHVSYAILHRVGWSFAICVYIICEAHTHFEPLKYTIGARIFRPLSTLSYAALLIHTPIQLLIAGLQRSPPYSNTFLSVWMACGDVIFSYVAALFLHLFIEAPLAGLKDFRLHHITSCIMNMNAEQKDNPNENVKSSQK